VSARRYAVACDEHGEMTRDEARLAWACPDAECPAWLPDEQVYRLVSAAPADGPDPVSIVVT
jgi:hypothetical protein